MQLYKIDKAIEDAINLGTDPETGELLNVDELESLLIEKQTKTENIALWIKNLRSDIEAMKAERDSFNQRIKTATNKMESLKDYLAFCLNGEKFETERVKVSYRRSEQVTISDEAAFLDWAMKSGDSFLRYKTPEIDKTKVKDELKAGFEIPYATIEEKQNLQIK